MGFQLSSINPAAGKWIFLTKNPLRIEYPENLDMLLTVLVTFELPLYPSEEAKHTPRVSDQLYSSQS